MGIDFPCYNAVQKKFQLNVKKRMNKKTKDGESGDNPKFGRLIIILFFVVLFLGFLTWLMETQFADFGY